MGEGQVTEGEKGKELEVGEDIGVELRTEVVGKDDGRGISGTELGTEIEEVKLEEVEEEESEE